MKVGTRLAGNAPAEIAESARRAERLGFDTTNSAETNHNPFLPLAIAAEHTQNVNLRTSIALAFARSPMDVAYLSWDLQAMSGGRFALGLGSQVRGHIVRRFSMNWTAHLPPVCASISRPCKPHLERLADRRARTVPRRPLRLQPHAARSSTPAPYRTRT